MPEGRMRIVFMGSARLGLAALERLRTERHGEELAGVVCQPERPRGRRLHPAPCPVGAAVEEWGLPVLTPERVNAPDSMAAIRALRPDVIVVIAYGQFLKQALLDLPKHGCLNLHASLLPRYRGAAPIQWAIAAGETETGVTAMRMNARMDAGPILKQSRVTIGPEETGGVLHDRLALTSAELLDDTLRDLRADRLTPRAQDDAQATFAPKLTKADGRIDWRLHAVALANRVRGFHPWPICWCRVPGEHGMGDLRIHAARAEDGAGRPGTVLAADGEGPLVATGEGALRLCRVQPAGRRVMTGSVYLAGHRIRVGDGLE
jgi:methionyl-tRNA formyltransferase